MVRGVTEIGEVLSYEPVLIVAEDAGDCGGDVEEVAFEGEDKDGVCAENENRKNKPV